MLLDGAPIERVSWIIRGLWDEYGMAVFGSLEVATMFRIDLGYKAFRFLDCVVLRSCIHPDDGLLLCVLRLEVIHGTSEL